MPTQADFQRITENVIKPIERHFGYQFDSETISDYVDDLSRYSDDTIKSSMLEVRRENKRRPTLAVIVEACRKYTPHHQVPEHKIPKTGFHCVGHAEKMHPQSAREILSSYAGQMALEIGVARDLLNEYECTGRKNFDEEFVLKCKEGGRKAADAMINAHRVKNPDAQTWQNIYDAMIEREKGLYAKFYRVAA